MTLPTSPPSEKGIDAAGVESFLDAVQAGGIELHSLQIARHGRVVAAGAWAPYDLERIHLGYSLSKSVTATAVATMLGRGELALDTLVVDVLPVDGLDVDPRWGTVQVQHCLSMTVGHTEDAWMPVMSLTSGSGAPMTSFLAAALATGPDAEPGTVFCYNQVATYVLSRIVAHVTGRQLLDVLRERVFDPLGIGEVLWHRCPEGFELGFSGCHLRPLDLMSLTQLWLDRGQRDGETIVSQGWFDRAARPFLPPTPNDAFPGHAGRDVSDWEQGYGFSYWMARHGHRADGAYGQYGIILPGPDVAIVINGAVEDMHPARPRLAAPAAGDRPPRFVRRRRVAGGPTRRADHPRAGRRRFGARPLRGGARRRLGAAGRLLAPDRRADGVRLRHHDHRRRRRRHHPGRCREVGRGPIRRRRRCAADGRHRRLAPG